ncbi:MAG: hypothetical protein KatS3mg003_1630 [Candidatus Nitrosocaldaceae archaeon]|nr:MAG: hypothetical protein KatS3mg003_0398 [Candidatus Nitrosocaldaceae archaeon]GIU72151.1 MAG: hypothetical protein KatS3mg003_1630 [Candidatus Nitrosocaldaceae archaeon]
MIVKKNDIIILSSIIAIILIIGSVLIATESLPEHRAKDFNPLANMTIKQDMRIIKHTLFDDNVFSYAINDVAEEAVYIAVEDQRIRDIIDTYKGLEITISGIQPVVMIDASNNELHNGIGEVIITVNWEEENGILTKPERFDMLIGKSITAHQKIWTIIVDLNARKIIDTSQKERVIENNIKPNLVYMDVNVYLPKSVIIEKGTTIEWLNVSYLPHNVLGVYKTEDGEEIFIDSKFMDYKSKWRYTFDKRGIFEYRCSIHLEDGMKGVIIIE